MQENHTQASPRMLALMATAVVIAAMALFTWLGGTDTAGAASTGSASSATAPTAQAAQRTGDDCPKDQGGSASGSSSDSDTSTPAQPSTDL